MMNQEDIFKKVGQILNELQDQYDFLAQNPAQLNELELELFLANANFLSDHVQIVKKINSNKPQRAIAEHAVETPVKTEEPVSPKTAEAAEPEMEIVAAEVVEEQLPEPEEVTPEPVFKDELFKLEAEPSKLEFLLNETPATDKFEFEAQPVEAIFDRQLSKEEEDIIAQKQKQMDSQFEQSIKEEPAPEALPEIVPDKVEEKIVQAYRPEPVLDKVEEKVISEPEANTSMPTLNDLLAGRNNLGGSLNEENNKTAITDLKQAINLNQKLLFVKDLFNGYNLAYSEVIDLINKMPDFKTADHYLQQNYAAKNNWAAKQSTVDQFYELLNQRFPAK